MFHPTPVAASTAGRCLLVRFGLRSAALAATLVWTLSVQAQPSAPAARPDPLDPKAVVPAPGYGSAFSQYRRLGEDKPVSWRDANDTVTRIGGWRVYAREAQQQDPAPPAKPLDAAPAAKPNDPAQPMPAGHGGHKMP
jgi:hypothetical protein